MGRKWLPVILPLAVLLLALPVAGAGCDRGAPAPSPAAGALARTLVPDLPLDIYLYLKQEQPTLLPAGTLGLPADLSVVSLAVWGVAQEDDFGYGYGLTLSSTQQASEVYQRAASGLEGWTRLAGNIIYFVPGSGAVAQSLRRAIEADDFKPYDDAEGLEAAAALPATGGKIAVLALAKPSPQLVGVLTRDVDEGGRGLIELVLRLVNLKVVAASLYAPGQIDVAGLIADFEAGGITADRDLGVLAMVRSGLPGLAVKPAVAKILDEQGFQRTGAGGANLYRRSWATGAGGNTYVIVRVEGNRVFIAVSGRESYAETLISAVK